MATDVKAKVKVEFDSDLQAAREALEKWKAERKKPRVCRGCKWLDEIECRMLKFDPDDWEPSSVELGVRRSPSDAMTDCGFVTIANPDDFGCNKWEAK